MSVRALSYKLPAARQALARILDLLDKIEFLRVTLQEVEQTIDAVRDSADLAELKRILLDRIAELEIAQARPAEPAVHKIYKLAS